MKQREFCIVGLGLLGGSYAIALTNAGCRVTAVDVRAEALDYARGQGWIAEGALPEQAEALLGRAEVIVLGLYPQDVVPWVQQFQPFFQPGVLLTDVCGVKRAVVERVQDVLRPDAELIACHPMAGKEVSGVEYADCAIFRPANFLITPTEKNSAEAIAFAHELGRTLGFAHITELSCARHDEMIGYVSQLTHAIAVALMNANDDPELPLTTGDSFRDLTRIAKINDKLWSELFLENSDLLIQEIDRFSAELGKLRTALEQEDKDALCTMFRASTARRKLFDRTEAEKTREN